VECAEVIVNIHHPDLDRVFHYLVPEGTARPLPGTRVSVPFGHRTVEGWIIGYSEPEPGIVLREIAGVVNKEPDFSAELLKLAHWMAAYYLHPLAVILDLMSPPPKPKRLVKCKSAERIVPSSRPVGLVLTAEQQQALQRIEIALHHQKGGKFLLYGVTGSGKTEVYLRASRTALALGRQVLYLVPEIALTLQVGALFQDEFGERAAIWHHRLTQSAKYQIWDGLKKGKIDVLIGTRSAVFAPFCSLGLVVIDEEHDPSYKEQESPYYHAVQVALKRASYNKAVVVLGSATPSLESYTAARRKKLETLMISSRPGGRHLPRFTVIDMRQEDRRDPLSQYLQNQIRLRLEQKEQIILFINRRGFAPIVFCSVCGEVLKCRDCSISLVYHQQTRDLRCHYCNRRLPVPAICPSCGSKKKLRFLGAGIQRIEQELCSYFPGVRVMRLDYDTTRSKGSFNRILGGFARQEADILLGTQMVTKGHDFHGVTLVGVLNADLSLNLPDYRSAERTFQTLNQVAGRAGRGQQPGEVVVQTYYPNHYSIAAACQGNDRFFYQEETKKRYSLGYPPFGELIRVRLIGKRERDVQEIASQLACSLMHKLAGDQVSVLGPAQAPVLKVKGDYRWQVMLKGNCLSVRNKIRDCLSGYHKSNGVIINVEVDPFGF
jgi:primosomal protein N' (replication factor Y)